MAEPRISIRTYVGIYVLVILLAALTTGLAFVDLGRWGSTVAMAIAGAKTLLVLLYFMHLRHGTRLAWIFAGAGVCFLGILFFLTLNDILTRSWLSP